MSKLPYIKTKEQIIKDVNLSYKFFGKNVLVTNKVTGKKRFYKEVFMNGSELPFFVEVRKRTGHA